MTPGKAAGKRGDTREQVLEAACIVFSEKGFRDATVADICERAGANIAAVNYYFRDKETLYVEAWRLAFQRSLLAHPPDGGISADASAEERLRAHVLSLMLRIVDPESHEFEIVHKELANPSGLLAEVMRESVDPLRRALSSIVRELLGARATDQHVQLCEMSLLAQCFHPMMRERHRKLLHKRAAGHPPCSVELTADHIVRFSLAGIQDMRRRIEAGELDGRR